MERKNLIQLLIIILCLVIFIHIIILIKQNNEIQFLTNEVDNLNWDLSICNLELDYYKDVKLLYNEVSNKNKICNVNLNECIGIGKNLSNELNECIRIGEECIELTTEINTAYEEVKSDFTWYKWIHN